MLAWNTSESDIRESAAAIGVALHGDWAGNGVVPVGRALRFRLSVDTGSRREDGTLPFQRISQSRSHSRRLAAVCWHGHREFMRELFRRCPEARIKTALADYRNAADFEAKYRSTFGNGNDYNLAYGQACACSAETESPADRLEYLRAELRAERMSYGELAELQGLADQIDPGDIELLEAAGVPEHQTTFGTLHPDGTMTDVRTIAQSAIRACPHVILVPEHYRPDGSCRCNDPDANMSEWGYKWDGTCWR